MCDDLLHVQKIEEALTRCQQERDIFAMRLAQAKEGLQIYQADHEAWVNEVGAVGFDLLAVEQERDRLAMELAKWTRPHPDGDLEEMRRQAKDDAQGPTRAYVNALEYHLAHSRRDLAAVQVRISGLIEYCSYDLALHKDGCAYGISKHEVPCSCGLDDLLESDHAALDAVLAKADDQGWKRGYENAIEKQPCGHPECCTTWQDTDGETDIFVCRWCESLAEARREGAEEMRERCSVLAEVWNWRAAEAIGDLSPEEAAS